MSIMLFCGLILIASIDTTDIDKHLWKSKWNTCIVFLKVCFFYFFPEFWLAYILENKTKQLSICMFFFFFLIIMPILLSMKWVVALGCHRREIKVISLVLWNCFADLCSILKIYITSLVEDQLYFASQDNSLGSRHKHLLFSKIQHDTWAVTTSQWNVS